MDLRPSKGSCDIVTVTPPKGGVCHVTSLVTGDVTECHMRNIASDEDKRPHLPGCHGDVTADVTGGVTADVTTLSAAQLRPLAQLIAGSLAGVLQVDE